MKLRLLSLLRPVVAALVVLAPLGVAAQVPANGGLENWAVRNGTEQPAGWSTLNDIAAAAGSPILPNTTIKSTDARSGSFAARLENKSLFGFGVAPGLLILGRALTSSDLSDFSAGVPYTGRPARLDFQYKLTGTAAALVADSATVAVLLTRTVNGQQQAVAVGSLVLRTAAANYTPGTVPLAYTSNQTPDSLQIVFASALSENSAAGVATAGTVFTVDDIALAGGTVQATKNPALQAALNVYPNPSPNGDFHLSSVTNPAVATAPYTISDATGRVVRTAPAAPLRMAGGRLVELRGLPAGVYLLQLRTPEGPLTRKLLLP